MNARVTHVITALNLGGAERALYSLLTGGLASEFESRVISLTDTGHFGPLLRAAGIAVTCLGMRRGRLAPAALFLGLRKALRNAPSDLLQGWMYHGNLAASMGSLAAPRTAVAWNIRHSLEGLPEEGRGTRFGIRVGRLISRMPKAIIYNSDRSRRQHEEAGFASARGHVIPNGFDTQAWHPSASDRLEVRSEIGLRDEECLLGFVGRHHPLKDVPNFLRSLRPAMSERSNLHAALVGPDIGPASTDLRPLLSELPSDRVHVLGRRTDVARLMRGFDLLCLSSCAEGFPNVLGEAMASGVPCITTDVGSAAEVVSETGWVVPARDPAALAAAIVDAASLNPAARRFRGERARERICQSFSLDAVVDRYRSLYREMLRVK